MRGSVVFLAVFAVTSCSVGVNGAHFVKSGVTGYGTGRGNRDAPEIGENAFGNGENDGHHIGKRSSLDHDIARQAADLKAAARRQQMIGPNALFPKPIPAVGAPLPGMAHPIFLPPLPTIPWNHRPLVKFHDLPLRGARPFPTWKFPPLSQVKAEAMKIISNALPGVHTLPVFFPIPSVKRSFARSLDFYRSDPKNRRGRYSDWRSHSPLPSYQTLPDSLMYDAIDMPLDKDVRDTATAQPGTEENLRREVRFAIIKYFVKLWNKIKQLFKPGSHSGGGTGGVPPKGETSTGGGIQVGSGLPPEEHEVHTERPHEENEIHTERPPEENGVHTERPPEENVDDVVIQTVPPPVDDNVQIIHLPSREDDYETAEDSAKASGSDVDEDYYEPVYPIKEQQTNWEPHNSARMGDSFFDADDYTYVPRWSGPVSLPKFRSASKIRDTSAGTRRKHMRDDFETITNIFGRFAD